MMCAGLSPRSTSACSTPTWARPFMPPPPRTSVKRVLGCTGRAACAEGECAGNVVENPMTAPLVWRRLARDRWALAGLAIVLVLAAFALAAPWLAPGDPVRGDLATSLHAPGAAFLLGTDQQGRDVLTRILFGARLSLTVGVVSQAIALVLGLGLGLAAGYSGRWPAALIMPLAAVPLASPPLLLLIAIAAAVRPSLPMIFVVIGVVGWAGMARLVRGQVLDTRALAFVHAARPLGASAPRIVTRHVFPNVLAPVIVAATLRVGCAIMAGAAVSV